MIHKNLNINIESVEDKYILYLHGWGGNSHSLDIIKDNIQQHGSICLDFFCADNIYDSDYDTYMSALDVYLELKERGISEVIIIAHSYGGRVALLLSSIFDIRIKKMILISSAGINLFSVKKLLKIINYKLIKLAVKLKIYDVQIYQKYGSQDYKKLDNNMKRIFSNIVKQDLRYLLNNIKCDTLLIYGNKDKITPITIMRLLSKKISDSKCVIVEGNHFAYINNCNNVIKYIKSYIDV